MKRIFAITLALALLISANAAFAETALTSSSAEQSLQQAYYDSDYDWLDDPESVYKSVTLEEAYVLFQQEGNYLFLLGGSWCHANTWPIIGYVNEVAKEYGVDTIYNLDLRLDGTTRATHIRENAGTESNGVLLPGTLYNYLYGELVTNWLPDLNNYVEYKTDTEYAITYTDAQGEAVVVPKLQVPFIFLYNKDNTDESGAPAPIVAALELMKVREDFVDADGNEITDAIDEYKATLREAIFEPVKAAGLTPFTDADYIRIIYNQKSQQELFAEGAQINIETITYRQLQWLLEQDGSYLIFLGGSWCPNTQAVIGIINDYAVANNVTVYNFDTKLDGGYARKYWGYEKDLHIRDSANEFANLYVDLVLKYFPNIETEYTLESGNAISYTNADGETLTANKLQVPYFLAYTKGLEDDDGHFTPITGYIEQMLTLNPESEDYVYADENYAAYSEGVYAVIESYAQQLGIESVKPE